VKPSFLGIGAQRAGTTWLDRLLRSHPEVFLPKARKELHYFDEHYDRGPTWYESFFEGPEAAAARAVGEITPRYLFEPEAPRRIARDLPDARLLAVLRHPVDRAYSQYALTVRDQAYSGGFDEFLAERPEAIERGLYHRQLSRYLEHVPRERLLVLVLEQATADPEPALARLAGFLRIDAAGFDRRLLGERTNASHRPRHAKSYAALRRVGSWLREHDLDLPVNAFKRLGGARLFGTRGALPALDPEERARLGRHFAADVQRLKSDLGLDLATWEPKAP